MLLQSHDAKSAYAVPSLNIDKFGHPMWASFASTYRAVVMFWYLYLLMPSSINEAFAMGRTTMKDHVDRGGTKNVLTMSSYVPKLLTKHYKDFILSLISTIFSIFGNMTICNDNLHYLLNRRRTPVCGLLMSDLGLHVDGRYRSLHIRRRLFAQKCSNPPTSRSDHRSRSARSNLLR